jgi:hypothetical protein
VWGNPAYMAGNRAFEFELIIAVQSKAGAIDLYYSCDNYLLEAELAPICIGTGQVPAEQWIDLSSTSRTDRGRLIAFMSYLFGLAKRQGSGVGGMTLFLDFGTDGTFVTWYGDRYLAQVERYAGVFQMRAWSVATATGSPDLSDEDFEHALGHFNDCVRADRAGWAEEKDVHRQTRHAYRLTTAPKGQLPRKSTKRDR